jgi:ribose 5-phosphate isomerase B
MRDLITAEDVLAVPEGGELHVPVGTVVTAWAEEAAKSRGVRIVPTTSAPGANVVALGGDHGGYAAKEALKPLLVRLGYRVRDVGTHSTDPVDYPDIALAVARLVRSRDARFGILVDGAGIGSAMAANKVPGVRAALCVDVAAAKNAREHNDANVLTLGAKFAAQAEIVETFLAASCTEERHVRRVAKITAIEEAFH